MGRFRTGGLTVGILCGRIGGGMGLRELRELREVGRGGLGRIRIRIGGICGLI